jgi:GGDEF domain-containing protein
MSGRHDFRLLFALAPGLLLGTIAVVYASDVSNGAMRFLLLFAAIGSVAFSSWRVGAAALGGITRAHGVPNRLQLVAGEHRRLTFDRETGLHAEWYFRLRMEEEIARAKRYEQPFTVLTVAARSASLLQTPRREVVGWLREVDFAGDLGDRLAICLPNTSRSGAWQVVERLTRLAPGLDIALSEFPADGATTAALLHEDGRRNAAVRVA